MRQEIAIRQAIATVLALFAVFAIVGHCVGCAKRGGIDEIQFADREKIEKKTSHSKKIAR